MRQFLVTFAQNSENEYDEQGKDKEGRLRKSKKVVKSDLRGSQVMAKKMDKSQEIMGVTISGTRISEVLKKIGLQRKEMLHVATVNSEYIMEARGNLKFNEVLRSCLTVADGWGVVWGTRILGAGAVERVSGVQLVEEILKRANERGEKVFLLGAAQGVAERAASAMAQKYPGATYSWYEGARTVKVEKSEEASMTIAKINGFEPDYLLVAYGSPWQDIWIEENRPYLRARVAIGVGGVFDEWAGLVAVCPNWIDQFGLKWLWRVVHEPWRFRRVVRVWQYGLLVLLERVKRLF